MARYSNILQTVGSTPLIRLNRLAPEGINIYAKVEAFNPMGSVKDRLALAVIEDAERSGALTPGQTVIEATSGNTGIGLAMVCAVKGYPLVIVMAESMSVERRRLMRFLGAKVVLTPAADKGSGMQRKAEELAAKHGWFLTRQFENEANADAHAQGTAREILADLAGERLDFFVTGYGTGGTLKGVGQAFREHSPHTAIVLCEPDNSRVLASGTPVPENGSHPLFRPHPVQGWGPDFIPKLTADARDADYIDRLQAVDGNDALRLARALAREEGIFAGISAGATLAGALKVAETAPAGSNIVCMLPDTGERYLSTMLFSDIGEIMTEEEEAISRSTPSARFDTAPVAAATVAPPELASLDPGAVARFEQLIGNPRQSVVLFAHQWCEFSWALRRLFTQLGVPFVNVDMDSIDFTAEDLGVKLRSVLHAKTGFATVPQVYLGHEYFGDCSQTIEAARSGRLQDALNAFGIKTNQLDRDAASFLPGWMQPRNRM